MTTADDVLARARADLGYTENPPGSNRTKYGEAYGLNGVAWCAEAVSYWFARAGMPLTISTSKGFASTPAGAAWFIKHKRAGATPRKGAIAFMAFPGGPNEPWRRVLPGRAGVHHVGIVEDPTGPNGTVVTIEGNTAVGNDRSGGRVMRRYRNPAHVVVYGYPDYTAASSSSSSSAAAAKPTPPPAKPTPAPAPTALEALMAKLTEDEDKAADIIAAGITRAAQDKAGSLALAIIVKRGVSAAMTIFGQSNSGGTLQVFAKKLDALAALLRKVAGDDVDPADTVDPTAPDPITTAPDQL